MKTDVARRRRDSQKVGRHAHQLDLTCRPFSNRVVVIDSPWPINFKCFGNRFLCIYIIFYRTDRLLQHYDSTFSFIVLLLVLFHVSNL